MWVGSGAVRHSRAILGGTLVLLVVAGIGLSQLRFIHKPLDWFPPDNPVYIAAHRIDRDLRGATTAEVLIDTGRENGLQSPDTLKGIEAATREVETIREGELFVGKAISVVDILKETHQALNANDPAFRRIPDDPALAAQELLLFENSGSDDLERFTDSQFREGRVTLRVPMVNAMLYDPFLERIHEIFTRHLGEHVTLTVTGRSTLRARTFSALVKSMAKSYAFALAVITPLMMMLIGNVRLGLISMAPNLLPVIFTLAAMGLLGIPLDASSVVIGSIVIGLAVDDTIHLMRRFQLEYRSARDVVGAVREIMCTTGSALFFTTLVLTTGFGVMGSLGSLKNTVYFGYLSALGIALAFVANVLLTPALISLATRLERRGGLRSR
jgi:predicted RND superfamily exporter protein